MTAPFGRSTLRSRRPVCSDSVFSSSACKPITCTCWWKRTRRRRSSAVCKGSQSGWRKRSIASWGDTAELGRSLSRAHAANAARSAKRARVRAEQLAKACAGSSRLGPALFRSLVRRLDQRTGPGRCPIARGSGAHVARSDRVAATWIHRRRRVPACRADGSFARLKLGPSLRLLSGRHRGEALPDSEGDRGTGRQGRRHVRC